MPLRRLQELSAKRLGMARAYHALASPKATKKPESADRVNANVDYPASGDSGCECEQLAGSGFDLLCDISGISANSWQHR